MQHYWEKKKAENKYLGGFFPCVIDQKVLFGMVFLFVYLFPLLKICQPSGFPRVTPDYVASAPAPSD